MLINPYIYGGGSRVFPARGLMTLSGLAPTSLVGSVVSPGAGLLTMSGRSPLVGFGALVPPAFLSMSGAPPDVGRAISPAAGALTITGVALGTAVGFIVQPSTGLLSLIGQPLASPCPSYLTVTLSLTSTAYTPPLDPTAVLSLLPCPYTPPVIV